MPPKKNAADGLQTTSSTVTAATRSGVAARLRAYREDLKQEEAQLPKLTKTVPFKPSKGTPTIAPKAAAAAAAAATVFRKNANKRNSAQERLNRLCEDLKEDVEQQKSGKKPSTSKNQQSISLPSKGGSGRTSQASSSNKSLQLLKEYGTLDTGFSSPASYLAEPEQMEWQSLMELTAAEAEHKSASDGKHLPTTGNRLDTDYMECAASFANYRFLIVDTSIYLDHIEGIIDLFSDPVPANKPQPILVVPYKVLQQLESATHDFPDKRKAILRTNRFLCTMLEKSDKRFRGQRLTDDACELFEQDSASDSIINCALQVQSVAGDRLVVVTDDCCLLTKALVSELEAS
uniref:PINc domain-containing protein n=1 Tax=Anopheles albimanus TaxID=7167 RepID=A0A182FR28_ANOAL